MPGGVNSPVRAFRSVGGQPIVMDSVKGSRMWDIDGNEYIDYVGSWGPAIIGHADDEVLFFFTASRCWHPDNIELEHHLASYLSINHSQRFFLICLWLNFNLNHRVLLPVAFGGTSVYISLCSKLTFILSEAEKCEST